MKESTLTLTEEEIARGADVFLFLLNIQRRIEERQSSHPQDTATNE